MIKRPLKFKAWSKTHNEWFMCGDAFDLNFSGKYGEFLFDNDAPCDMGKNDLEWVQFTGICDKNGKEVYEGDVVKGHRPIKNRNGLTTGEERFIGSVEYDSWWGAFRRNGVKQYQGISAELMYPKEIEVIGNIYENPELLEVA